MSGIKGKEFFSCLCPPATAQKSGQNMSAKTQLTPTGQQRAAQCHSEALEAEPADRIGQELG